ncbi:unnamed protein product [Rhizophagus irregularis]|nr:unnamed protein product [Rhizophagus irregularis]
MMNDHLHQHPFIPTVNGEFHSSIQIWTNAVEEIYNFCKQNSLPWLWVYLWNEWYNAERWLKLPPEINEFYHLSKPKW